MLEGDVVVHAKSAVYDPQNGNQPTPFRKNGSTAENLALVLNQIEAKILSGHGDPIAAAKALLKSEKARAVIIKCGPMGAYVAEGTSGAWVCCYKTSDVWAIGSGDVFSAVFATFWMKKRTSAKRAAELASKATALYCSSRSLPTPKDIGSIRLQKYGIEACKKYKRSRNGLKPKVYLAGPFFRLGETWLLERVRESLLGFGLSVFSPLHDVGYGIPIDVAAKDLQGLRSCDLVFAILGPVDAGTVYEIGFARSQKIPVIVFAERVHEHELTMLLGTGCHVNTDLTTALYKAAWEAYGL